MPKILEVIVTSVEEAIEAEAGGADRLELVRRLDLGGLTPDGKLVEEVLQAISVPVRVMLRRHPDMSAGNQQELRALESEAAALSEWPLDGLVVGFLKDGVIDCPALASVLSAAPAMRFTFHRAFDELADSLESIRLLQRFPQIDRILTSGGSGDWATRRDRMLAWQRVAGPQLRILVAAGICPEVHLGLQNAPELLEVHTGRAARHNQSISEPVLREAVRALRSAFQ